MKLDPGEHSLFGSFKSGPNAEACRDELKQAGFGEVQLDRIGRFGFRPEYGDNPEQTGNVTSVVEKVLNPNQGALRDDTRILLNATTDASGMSSPSTKDGANFLVVLVCANDRVDEAVEIIHKHGGRV